MSLFDLGFTTVACDNKCIATFKETGCKHGATQYQCAQAFYQKQLLASSTEAQNLQVASMRQQIETQKSEIQLLTISAQGKDIQLAKSQKAAEMYVFGMVGSLIIGVLVGIFIAKRGKYT